MYNADTLGWMFLFAAAVLFWRDSMRARETAIATCRHACNSYQVQFLDDTVSLARIVPALGATSKPCFKRTYEFELSESGTDRHVGSITLLGSNVETIYLPVAPDKLLA